VSLNFQRRDPLDSRGGTTVWRSKKANSYPLFLSILLTAENIHVYTCGIAPTFASQSSENHMADDVSVFLTDCSALGI